MTEILKTILEKIETNQSKIDQARIACGLERFRLSNGKLPSRRSTVSYARQIAPLAIIAFVSGSYDAKWK